MDTLYGSIPGKTLSSNLDDLIGQVFKLLPYKEDGYEDLDYYFSTLLFRLNGFASILNSPPELVTVMSYLEAARKEDDFRLYRKAVLDSCSILKKLQEDCNGTAG